MRGVFGRRGDGERSDERVWPGSGANPSRVWWRDLRKREASC